MDGAFSMNNDKHGIGFVARDSAERFLKAGSRFLWAESCAEMVEAKAVMWALSKACEYDWNHIIIESDCKLVVEALKGAKQQGHI